MALDVGHCSVNVAQLLSSVVMTKLLCQRGSWRSLQRTEQKTLAGGCPWTWVQTGDGCVVWTGIPQSACMSPGHKCVNAFCPLFPKCNFVHLNKNQLNCWRSARLAHVSQVHCSSPAAAAPSMLALCSTSVSCSHHVSPNRRIFSLLDYSPPCFEEFFYMKKTAHTNRNCHTEFTKCSQ